MTSPFRKMTNNSLFHSSPNRGEGVALSFIGSAWMADKWYYTPGELEYMEYKEYATGQYEDLLQSFSEQSPSTIDAARSLGVQREWDMYQLFAELDAPQDVFRYVDDNGEIAVFSDSEIDSIRGWDGQGRYPVEGIEGHHLQTIRDNPHNVELAGDPDNILFATETGHRQFLHGGNTLHSTAPEYMDVQWNGEEMLSRTLEHHQDLLIPSAAQMGLVTIGSSAALYTTVSLLLQSLQLRNDPRPWVEKKSVLYRSFVSTAVTSSILATAGFGATLTLEALLSGFSAELAATAIDEMLMMNVSFAAVAITAGLIKYSRDLKHGKSREEARADLNNVMTVALCELLAFQALGIGLELLGDLLADTFMDALIPDPTGILVGIRAAWSLFKAGKKIYTGYQNNNAFKECQRIRFEWLYGKALPPAAS